MNTSLPMLIDQFVSEVCSKDNETPLTYRSKLRRLIRWMDAQRLPISQLTFGHLNQFRQSLFEQRVIVRGSRPMPGKLSPFTIHTCLRTVKHFLTWAYRKGFINFDPSLFKISAPPPPDPKPVSAENALSLLYAAARFGKPWEQARNLAMLYMLRDTAGRISAILKADVDNLDLARGTLCVREKGDKPHSLYINEPTIQALTVWLQFRPELEPKDNALFISQRGTGLTRPGFYSVMRRLRETAQIQGRSNAHAFRHAWVRDFLQGCGDLSKASQTLAHKNIRVTAEYYARWADRDLKEAHARYSPGAELPVIKPVN
jgi:integrase/recombinase XerD